MSKPRYPQSVLEVLDETMTFRSAALRAVQQFARTHPWQGKLNHDLADAHSIAEPDLTFGVIDGSSSGASHYVPSKHRIVLTGKLSVTTFLHEFGHGLGLGEKDACRWSINLFKRCFPTQYGRLVHVGHMLIWPSDLASRLRRRSAS